MVFLRDSAPPRFYVRLEEVLHLRRSRCGAGIDGDAERIEDGAQRALVLVRGVGLGARFDIRSDHGGEDAFYVSIARATRSTIALVEGDDHQSVAARLERRMVQHRGYVL